MWPSSRCGTFCAAACRQATATKNPTRSGTSSWPRPRAMPHWNCRSFWASSKFRFSSCNPCNRAMCCPSRSPNTHAPGSATSRCSTWKSAPWAARSPSRSPAASAPAPWPRNEPQGASPMTELTSPETGSEDKGQIHPDVLQNIPVTLSIEVGRAVIKIRDLLRLTQGSVVELDRIAGEPLDLLVNNTVVAQGEVVLVNDRYGIRLTRVVPAAERLDNL